MKPPDYNRYAGSVGGWMVLDTGDLFRVAATLKQLGLRDLLLALAYFQGYTKRIH